MGSAIRRGAGLALLCGLGLALASLDSPPRRIITISYSDGLAWGPSPLWIGAWCSPKTSTSDPDVWRQFADAGLDIAMRPLEDPNDRGRNVATLALLDLLGAPKLMARDDAVHPDEATRPGWRDRVLAVAATYRGHPSLAGYFLADEPKPALFDQVAEVAAAFADADPAHPVYVNLLPIPENASFAEQARWRADAARLIRRGKLRQWSFASYSQRRWGEDATFLLTLQNAAQVARETGTKFAAVLQFTGFGPLDPLSPAQLDYQAAEAIAHGAGGIIWFTYWTPNPREVGIEWKGGAIEYDGTPSPRLEMLRLANEKARALAREFQGRSFAVAHRGGAFPRGAPLSNARMRDLVRADGGPMTIATADHRGPNLYLVINRDRVGRRLLTLEFARGAEVQGIFRPASPDIGWKSVPKGPSRAVVLDLSPGESVVLRRNAP